MQKWYPLWLGQASRILQFLNDEHDGEPRNRPPSYMATVLAIFLLGFPRSGVWEESFEAVGGVGGKALEEIDQVFTGVFTGAAGALDEGEEGKTGTGK